MKYVSDGMIEGTMISVAEALNPDWTPPVRYVHDWRRYINEELETAWHTFAPEQRILLAKNADGIAAQEEWD